MLVRRAYCDRYSNGTLLRLGRCFSIRCRTDSTLLSPRIKAIIDPIMMPPIPPTAIPSRNMRLRIVVIVDPLSSQDIVDMLLFSPYSTIYALGEIIFPLLSRLSFRYHNGITMLHTVNPKLSQSNFTPSNKRWIFIKIVNSSLQARNLPLQRKTRKELRSFLTRTPKCPQDQHSLKR